MEQLKVGVKFCGHCNPAVSGSTILIAIEKAEPRIIFVPWDDVELDLMLVLSGCAKACAGLSDFSGPTLKFSVIQRYGTVISVEQLADEIVRAIVEIDDWL